MPASTPFVASGGSGRLAPARWLIGMLIVGTMLAALALNLWGVHERRLGEVSRTSGQPGFAMEALVDPSGDLSFDQVLARQSEFAVPAKSHTHPPCIWYRLTVDNDTPAALHSILAVDNDFILQATFYQQRVGQPPLIERSGTTLRWFDRTVPAAKVAFEIELKAHGRSVFFVRINDRIKQPGHFFIWNDVATFKHLTELYKIEFTGYFALWFGLFVYNAFLYAVLRRRDYLLYLAYLLCIAVFLGTASEISALIVGWPLWPLRGMVTFIAINLTTFSLARFSRSFLETPTQLPKADRWIKGFSVAVLVSSIGTLCWLLPSIAWIYESFVALLNIALLAMLPICGLILYFRRNRQAGIYVLAFVPLVVAMVYLLESTIGIPDGRSNTLPYLTASALEAIFLALALAWRYRLITDEADGIKASYTAHLEQEVAQRTRELLATNASLARANQDKDRVFSILGHDLRGPAQMLSGLSRMFTDAPEMLSPSERADLAAEIEEACRSQLELLDNLLLWGKTQSGGAVISAQPTDVAELIQASTKAHAQAARRKGIRLTLAAEPNLLVKADPRAAQTIVRNLVGNAVKFTGSGGSVTVRAIKKGSQIEIVVSDTGVGIEPDQFGALLSGPVRSRDGTEAEKGSGVGLTLCRDLARSSGGDLTISSELRKGTTATLVLPAGA